jgi:hypothetical protein
MKLVWSRPSSATDRPRTLLLMAVVCVFLGGTLAGRPGLQDAPRPFRAAIASLLATGGLFFLVGGAALAFGRSRKSQPPLSLARPYESSEGSGLQEEEQR